MSIRGCNTQSEDFDVVGFVPIKGTVFIFFNHTHPKFCTAMTQKYLLLLLIGVYSTVVMKESGYIVIDK